MSKRRLLATARFQLLHGLPATDVQKTFTSSPPKCTKSLVPLLPVILFYFSFQLFPNVFQIISERLGQTFPRGAVMVESRNSSVFALAVGEINTSSRQFYFL